MNELSKIFGSAERLRLLRFLLRDTSKEYTFSDIEEKTKIKSILLRKELSILFSVELLNKNKTKVYTFSNGVSALKEAVVYKINNKFKYLESLSTLVLDYTSIDREVLLSRLKGFSRIKFLLLSGIFTGDEKSRLDILYVGEQIKNKEIEKAFNNISIELGRDIKYVIMDIEEFIYRKKMFDSFLMDVLEGKTEILIDKLPKY